MSRLTNERIDEILRKNFVMCETELECLAREVMGLREELKMSEHRTNEQCRDKARIGTEYAADVERVARERDAHEAEAKRQHELFNRERLRAHNLECRAENLQSGIDELTRERDEARKEAESAWIDFCKCRNAVERLTRERDEDRELLRLFRDCFNHAGRLVSGGGSIAVCQKYDDRFCQQHPEPSGELVPWDAETFPADCEWLKDDDGESRVIYRDRFGIGAVFGCVVMHYSWKEIMTAWKGWSRDGKNWHRCGVVR